MSSLAVSAERLKQFCAAALVKAGVSAEDAAVAALVLVSNNMRGTSSHGTVNLYRYVKQILGGGMNPLAPFGIVSEGPAWALADGNAGLGTVTSYKAMQLAISKARTSGIAMVSVRNSMHFGAAGFYALMAAQQDMIGLSMSNADQTMSVPGAVGRVIGNNPLSYAVPTGTKPVFLDIAMSMVAGLKIVRFQREGKDIPPHWSFDLHGNPTTDPAQFSLGGALAPIGGHKGYGLALMVEILSAVLSGAAVTRDIKNWTIDLAHPSDEGHLFIAVNIGMLMPIDRFKSRMDNLVEQIRQSTKAHGVERILLPGELELEQEEQSAAEGIELDEDTGESLGALAAALGMDGEFRLLTAEKSWQGGRVS